MRRSSTQGRASDSAEEKRRLARRLGWLTFAIALTSRLLFWQSTIDARWPGSAAYKGDAWTWLEYASALQTGQLFELGVPIRPPATAWLLDAVWGGGLGELAFAGMVWCVLGALAVALFHAAASRAFGLWVGLVTGLICAGSSGLMILSTSLNNETPYLAVLGAVLLVGDAARKGERTLPVIAWGGLNALACLIRVEHALFFALALAWMALEWLRTDRRGARRGLIAALLAFGLVLLPWHLEIWSRSKEFNHGSPSANAATERLQEAHERRFAYLVWEPGAEAAREQLPAFIRRPAGNFVAATVAHRGRVRVKEEDSGLLEEAFGYLPRPMAAFPFVVATGGLNFALANHAGADGGFDPAPLEAPPPLIGGPGAFPADLVRGLPPTRLAFTYPGHLRLVNEGYAVGLSWIVDHPGDSARLAANKLTIFWRGAALGATGWNLPLGAGGLRRAVDLATPEGRWPAIWRLLFLVVVGYGVALACRRPPAYLWLLFLASKLIVAVAFYGYARQGATAIPVVALMLALAADRLVGKGRPGQRRLLPVAVAVGGLLVGTETARFVSKPELVIDGRRVSAGGATDPQEHGAHSIEWR